MQAQTVTPTDLFVLMERAFRRRTRRCGDCHFTLPYRLGESDAWAVDHTGNCSSYCRLVLDEIVGEYRGRYCLPGAFKFGH